MLKKIRVLITFTSVLSLINGIAYLIFTQPSLRLLGIDATEFGMFNHSLLWCLCDWLWRSTLAGQAS